MDAADARGGPVDFSEVIDELVKLRLRDLAELSTEDVRARLWSEVTT